MIRCPNCGGSNPDDADWCGQCLKRFTAPPPPEPLAGTPAQSDPQVQAEPVSWLEGLPTAADAARTSQAAPSQAPEAGQGAMPEASSRGPFLVEGGAVSWTCARCDTPNPMEVEICSACGATLRDTLAPDDKGTKVDRDPKLTAFVSLAFPGVGHAYLGLWGQAVARMAIAAWMLAAVAAGWSIEAAGAKVLAAIFALVALGMWAVSAHDAFREAEGDPRSAILKGRMFLYLVLVLLGLLFVQLFLGASASNTAI